MNLDRALDQLVHEAAHQQLQTALDQLVQEAAAWNRQQKQRHTDGEPDPAAHTPPADTSSAGLEAALDQIAHDAAQTPGDTHA